MASSHTLPDSSRDALKQPFGVLIPDSQVTRDAVTSKLVGRNKIIATIGDRTSERMKELHIFSNLEIVDGREKRNPKDSKIPFSGDNEHLLKAPSPAGQLTDESIAAVKKSLEIITAEPKKTVRIEIDGEEDLLTLPVLAFFPENTIVLYGQPDQGLVIVGASGDARDLARKTLAEMGIKSLGK